MLFAGYGWVFHDPIRCQGVHVNVVTVGNRHEFNT